MAQPLEQVKLAAFDLSARTARRGARSGLQRVDRLKARWFLILQCAITAGLAWKLGQLVLGHPAPFFAPVAAIVTLGITYGQRLRRGIDVAIGVALGVFTGDLFVHLFGTGVWQIMIVAAVAMTLATLVGAGQIMIIQAGVQSIIATTLLPSPGMGLNRWLDAVVGCALALIIATVAPSGPVRRPRQVAGRVLHDLGATVGAAADALRAGDAAAADAVLERARAGEQGLRDLDAAAAEGIAVVRHSPFRRGQLPGVLDIADLAEPLDHANRNLRVLVRRCAVALWRGEQVPLPYVVLLDRLAEVLDFMGTEIDNRRLPVGARGRLVSLGADSAAVHLQASLSSVVILAQLRSIVADLLELTGLDYADARQAIPEVS